MVGTRFVENDVVMTDISWTRKPFALNMECCAVALILSAEVRLTLQDLDDKLSTAILFLLILWC